jgi:hypothetical protein
MEPLQGSTLCALFRGRRPLRWMKGEDLITHLGREYCD